MKLVRRVIEAEVIAEFLKNEFYQKEYDQCREQFEEMRQQLNASPQGHAG